MKSGALIEPTSFQPSATIPKKLPDDYVALNGVSAGGGIAFVTFKTDHGTVIAKVSIADAKILAEKPAPGEKFALNAGKLFFISDSDSTQVHILDAGTIQ